ARADVSVCPRGVRVATPFVGWDESSKSHHAWRGSWWWDFAKPRPTLRRLRSAQPGELELVLGRLRQLALRGPLEHQLEHIAAELAGPAELLREVEPDVEQVVRVEPLRLLDLLRQQVRVL